MLNGLHCLVFILTFLSLLYQVAGTRCYFCSSNSNRACVEKQKDDDKIITCVSGCVSVILPDASLFRGCLADVGKPNGNSLMELCDDDLCNGNVFPSDRLQCYQCSGIQCADIKPALKNASRHLCQSYIKHDTCYTEVASKTVINRGCTSDQTKGGQYRVVCNQPLCNASPVVKKITCWECDSQVADELACKLGKENEGMMRKCELDILFGRQGFCYTLHHEEHVRRGCGGNNEVEVYGSSIEKCDKSLCNNHSTLISHCFECDSKIDKSCMFLDTDRETVAKCSPETSSCFSCRDFGDHVIRGCGIPDQCIGACFSCWNGSLCNSDQIFECFLCDSLTNPYCDLLIHTDLVDKEVCKKGCQVSIQADIVHRGCLDEASTCSDENFCSPCYGDLCNTFYMDMECGVVRFTDRAFGTDSLEDETIEP